MTSLPISRHFVQGKPVNFVVVICVGTPVLSLAVLLCYSRKRADGSAMARLRRSFVGLDNISFVPEEFVDKEPAPKLCKIVVLETG